MTPKPITQNTLFYGDNLPILRQHVPDKVKMPPAFGTFKQAQKVQTQEAEQLDLIGREQAA